MRKRSKLLRDQPEHPLVRAIYWTEYVLKHEGAYHLQSPAKEYGVVQYYLIDVVLVCFIAAYVLMKLFIKLNAVAIRLFLSFIPNSQCLPEDELTKKNPKVKAEVNGFGSNADVRRGERTSRNGTVVSNSNSMTVEKTLSNGEGYKNDNVANILETLNDRPKL